MVDPAETHGKRIAMVAWATASDGSDDVAVFTGVSDWDGHRLVLQREAGAPPLVVPAEWRARIRVVDPELKEMLLGADYSFSVTVGNLSDGDDGPTFRAIGLKWPSET